MIHRLAVACLLGATLSSPVLAADAALDGAFDWTGPYVRLHAGYGTSSIDGIYDNPDNDGNDVFAEDGEGSFTLEDKSVLAGGQVGFNLQRGNLVYGLEADIAKTNGSDSIAYESDNDELSSETDFTATLRLRVGVTTGNTLLFATGGVGYINTTYNTDDSTDETDPSEEGSERLEMVMPVAGAGVEHALTDHWSIKTDAVYFFGNETVNTADIQSDETKAGDEVNREDGWAARFGINYRF